MRKFSYALIQALTAMEATQKQQKNLKIRTRNHQAMLTADHRTTVVLCLTEPVSAEALYITVSGNTHDLISSF